MIVQVKTPGSGFIFYEAHKVASVGAGVVMNTVASSKPHLFERKDHPGAIILILAADGTVLEEVVF